MQFKQKQDSKRISPVPTFAGLGISILVHLVIFIFVGTVVIFEGKVPAVPFLGGMEEPAGLQMEEEMPLLEEENPITPETSAPAIDLTTPTDVTNTTKLATNFEVISSATSTSAFTLPTGAGAPSINTDALVARSTGKKLSAGPGGAGGGRSINFFGASATGTNFAILMDLTLSGGKVFDKTRAELLKTLKTIKKGNLNYIVIYFGGMDAGHMPRCAKNNNDFTESDFWFPSGVSGRKWLSGGSNEIDKIEDELNAVAAGNKSTWTGSGNNMEDGGIFFRSGTQYWGALNAALSLNPAPSSVFLLVEPDIGVVNENIVQANWEWYKEHGKSKPQGTDIHLIIGKPEEKTNVAAVELMADLLNGRTLSKSEKKDLITYVEL